MTEKIAIMRAGVRGFTLRKAVLVGLSQFFITLSSLWTVDFFIRIRADFSYFFAVSLLIAGVNGILAFIKEEQKMLELEDYLSLRGRRRTRANVGRTVGRWLEYVVPL